MLPKSLMNFLERSNLKLKFDEPLKNYTTFRIGGPATVLAEPENIEELRYLLKALLEEGEKFFILGGGSNLLISDEGFRGVVISLQRGEFIETSGSCENLKVGAGVKIPALLGWCGKNGFEGLEFMAGIPASLGGAIRRNAGMKEKTIADIIEDVTYLDEKGEIRKLSRQELDFSYRSLNLEFSVIVGATLKLKKSGPQKVRENIRFFFDVKRQKQPVGERSAGCIFKNPEIQSAGILIDETGLKGRRCGGACISEKHGNFIVNENNATAKDVLRLMDIVREEVRLKKNVILEPEVDIIESQKVKVINNDSSL